MGFIQGNTGFAVLRASTPIPVAFPSPITNHSGILVFTDSVNVGDVVAGVNFNGTPLTKIAGPVSARNHNINAWLLEDASPSGGTDTVQLTTASIQSNNTGAIILEYGGLAASAFDQTASGNAGAVSTAVSIGPSGATAQADEIVAAYAATLQLINTPAFTEGAGYTPREQFSEDDNVGFQMFVEDRTVGSIGTQTATATLNASVAWAGLLVTLKLAPLVHAISGNAGTPGATVTLSGDASGSTTAAGDGSYSFTGLVNGHYTITPSLAGFTFVPLSRDVTLAGADVTGVDFTATPVPSGGGGSGFDFRFRL